MGGCWAPRRFLVDGSFGIGVLDRDWVGVWGECAGGGLVEREAQTLPGVGPNDAIGRETVGRLGLFDGNFGLGAKHAVRLSRVETTHV